MSAADGCCKNASNVKYRVSLLWTSVLPRPNDLRDKTTFVPEPPGLATEQVVEVHDTPWPTLNRGVRDVLVRPPRTPHKVNVEKFQAFHNVSVWADVEVLEAAVVASKDELEARCDDGPDGAVEHAPKGGRSRTREHDVVNPHLAVAPATLCRAHPARADVPNQRCHFCDGHSADEVPRDL